MALVQCALDHCGECGTQQINITTIRIPAYPPSTILLQSPPIFGREADASSSLDNPIHDCHNENRYRPRLLGEDPTQYYPLTTPRAWCVNLRDRSSPTLNMWAKVIHGIPACRGEMVLLITVDPAVIERFRRALRDAGHAHVLVASTLPEATSLLDVSHTTTRPIEHVIADLDSTEVRRTRPRYARVVPSGVS